MDELSCDIQPLLVRKEQPRMRFMVMALMVFQLIRLLVLLPTPLSRRTLASALLQAASTSADDVGYELITYLDSNTMSQFDDDFNILN